VGEWRGTAAGAVHGSLQDHTVSAALVAELRADFTTMAMDRCGFGASGDRAPYSLDAEFADVAAVVDAVADRTGRPVALWGHSFGASCAMGGAALSARVGHLVLYEPSLGFRYPPSWIDRAEEALAAAAVVH
jgi:alpha-beta hydrolase superfamily lysophospholipase